MYDKYNDFMHTFSTFHITTYKLCHRQFNPVLDICSSHFTQLATMATIKTQAVLRCGSR